MTSELPVQFGPRALYKKPAMRPCRLCRKPTEKTRCPSCETKVRRYRCKQAGIELLGGKCSRCGYNKDPAALEFHHHSGDKSFTIGAAANRGWEAVKRELAKCVLICANCHRIEHSAAYRTPAFIAELKRYKGAPLPRNV